MKWEDAIIKVLAEAGTKMHTKVITDEIFAKRYRTNPPKDMYQVAYAILRKGAKAGLFRSLGSRYFELIGTSVKVPPAAAKTSGRVAPVVVVRPCTSYKPGDSKYKEAKDFVKPPVLSDLEMQFLELIVNFRLPLEMGEVCFADILDEDKLDVEISVEKKLRPQSVDATLLGEKLEELNVYIDDIKLKLERNPNENKYRTLLNHMRPAAEEAESRLREARSGKVEFKYPLLGEFVSGSEPRVIIYKNNIGSWEEMVAVFVHEMFHAWNYFNAGQKPRSVLAIDEPMVEFGTLYFLKKLEAFTSPKDSPYCYLHDMVSRARVESEKNVKKKQQSIGDVAAYGFGHYLYENLSDADSIDWIETYYKKSASISRNSTVKKVEDALIPVYPFKSENKVMKWFEKIIFSGRTTLATTRKSTAAKVDLSVSLYDLVLACIETIGRKCFEAKELYAFAPIFKVCMPQCENLEDELKNQLDELVKKGVLDAIPSDCYSVIKPIIPVSTPTTQASAPTKFKGGYTKDQSIPFAVEFLDDKITIKGKTAVETFIESLKHIGLSNVQHVGIMIQGYNLVSDVERPRYGKNKWQDYVDDKYIYTKLSNHRKITYLYEIANELGINIIIYDI